MNSSQDFTPVTEDKASPRRKRNNLVWPLILIFVGIILFVQNLGVGLQFNWWALFIFIPVVASLITAVTQFSRSGKFDTTVTGSLGSAVVVGTVAVILLFGMDWVKWWPLMVIAGGFSMFLSGLSSPRFSEHLNLTAFVGWNLWMGLAAMLLGVGFLVQYLPIPSLQPLIAGYRWWAIPILIAGAGGLVSALVLFVKNDNTMNWAGWALVAAGLAILAVGVLALLMLDWNLLLPVILIAIGVVVLTGVLSKK